jgi:hypothetical protein
MGDRISWRDWSVTPLPRRQRILVALWIVLTAALWNAIFEMMVVRGVKEYLFRAALHEAGRRPFTTWVATLWTSAILLAALLTIRTLKGTGYQVPGTGRTY